MTCACSNDRMNNCVHDIENLKRSSMTKRRIYLAGPMTGLPEFNYPAFNSAAEILRENRKNYVINPAENFNGHTGHERWIYIDESVDQIQGLAKLNYSSEIDCMVVTLDGWAESSGARLEVDLAHQLGLPVYELNCVFAPHWGTDCKIHPAERAPRHAPTVKPIDTLQETREAEGFAERSRAIDELSELMKEEPKRAAVLDEAKRLICGDRNNQYGPPGKDFNRAAQALTSLGFGKENTNGECEVLDDHDIAAIMIVLKLSRIMWSPRKRDSWVDVAGYAACGAEVAGAE